VRASECLDRLGDARDMAMHLFDLSQGHAGKIAGQLADRRLRRLWRLWRAVAARSRDILLPAL